MNTLEAIKKRRSVRSFTDKNVEKEKIEALTEAAIWAPNASNLQPWGIVILQREKNIKKAKSFSPGISGMPRALFIFCIDTEKAKKGGEDEARVLSYMDIAIAAQNVCLATTELGLGSCIVRSFNKKAIKELFDIVLEPELMIALGYPAEIPLPPERRRTDEVIVYLDERDE
jgi:nitroreductase